MSNPGDADSTPITSLQQLADYFAAGCKPAQHFRIGTEHEKFGFRLADRAAPPYQPTDGQPGSIRDAHLVTLHPNQAFCTEARQIARDHFAHRSQS